MPGHRCCIKTQCPTPGDRLVTSSRQLPSHGVQPLTLLLSIADLTKRGLFIIPYIAAGHAITKLKLRYETCKKNLHSQGIHTSASRGPAHGATLIINNMPAKKKKTTSNEKKIYSECHINL